MPVVRKHEAQIATSPAPNVRRSGTPIPQLRTSIISASPSAASEGAGIGENLRAQGMQQFSEELQYQDELRTKAKAQQDRVRILEADRMLSEWENRTLYDPDKGALNQRGKASFGLPDTVAQDFEKTYGALWQGLANDEQRATFDTLAQTRRSDVERTIYRHVSGQLKEFEATEQTQYLTNTVQAAIANADDYPRVSTERARGRIAIESFAEANGLGPEYTQAAIAKLESDIHVGVIGRLVQDKDLEARGYYDNYKDEILGTERAQVEGWLKEGSLRGESQRQADRILQNFDTQAEAHAEASTIADPEVRDSVVQRVSAEWTQRKQLAREDKEATLNQAKDALDQTMTEMLNRIDTRKPVFARDVVPPHVWTSLGNTERNALEGYARQYQEQQGKIETDVGTWYGLMREAANDPESFEKRDLMLSVSKLSASDFQEAAKWQKAIREGKTKDVTPVLDGVRTNERIINGALREIGIEPTAKENLARVDQLWQSVDEQVEQLQRITEKKATNDDIQKIVDDLLIEVGGQQGSWWSILPGGAPFFDQPGTRKFETERTATNPKTGERLVLRNGQWVKP